MASSVETVTEKVRRMALEAREKLSQGENSEAWKAAKNESDIKLFFKEEVRKGAMEKIEKRAIIGANNANVLEYKFDEYFYVKDGKVKRVIGFEGKEKGMYLHKIYKVMQTDLFQKLLQEYVNELGDMCFSCWAPSKNLNVIEFYWGPTKNHKWGDEDEEWDDDEEEKPVPKKETVSAPQTPMPPKKKTPAKKEDSDDESEEEDEPKDTPAKKEEDEKSFKAVLKKPAATKKK